MARKQLGVAASGPTDITTRTDVAALAPALNVQSGTSYTVQASDINKVLVFTSASAVTVTLPSALPAGFVCQVAQEGAGQVGFAAASGATLQNRQGLTHLAGQYAGGSLLVVSNAGSAAAWRFYGDAA